MKSPTRTRVHMQPVEALQPRPASMPLAFAQRWNSPFDNEGLKTTVQVFVTQPAYARTCVHAASEMDQETGGVLLGHGHGGFPVDRLTHSLQAATLAHDDGRGCLQG